MQALGLKLTAVQWTLLVNRQPTATVAKVSINE